MNREELIELLKGYNSKKKQIEQLKFELSHLPTLSENDLINSLSLGSVFSHLGVNSNCISDKTMSIALRYKDAGVNLINEAEGQILHELKSLEAEVNRLEYYLSLLDDKNARVIRMFYFEGRIWKEISDELGMVERTAVKQRDTAVNELLAMYQFIQKVRSDSKL